MKKIYLLVFCFAALYSAQAQKKGGFSATPGPKSQRPHLTQKPTAGCDTVNFDKYDDWGINLYTFSGGGGYLSGNNKYGDKEKAQFFDASSTSDLYITKVWIAFGRARAKDGNTKVPVKVYNGTSGKPGALLGSVDLKISDLTTDVKNNNYSEAVFNPAIALPTSKKIFVSVDISNLPWGTSDKDSIAVLSSDQDGSGTDAWDKLSNDKWASLAAEYAPGDFGFYIHPFLSENQDCASLPVHLLSFNAQAKGKNAVLDWKVTQEVNVKDYTVEKSWLNQPFTSVGVVTANNLSADHSYSFTDANALAAGNLLYYRLKSTDKDGKVNYSNVIPLSPSNSGLSIKVVNPFKNAVQLQVNAPYAQKLQGAVYDMQGRKVSAVTGQMLAAGQNLVVIQTGALAKGMYMLNVTVGRTTYKYKIVN